MQAERLLERRFHRGDYHRHVVRPTAGHHCIDRHLFHRARLVVGRHAPQNLVGVAPCSLQHPVHANRCRRHDGQAVRPIAFEAGLVLVLVAADLELPRFEGDATKANGQFIGDVRIGAEGSATGPLLGQADAERPHAGQLFPLAAVPTDCACHLAAMLDA